MFQLKNKINRVENYEGRLQGRTIDQIKHLELP